MPSAAKRAALLEPANIHPRPGPQRNVVSTPPEARGWAALLGTIGCLSFSTVGGLFPPPGQSNAGLPTVRPGPCQHRGNVRSCSPDRIDANLMI